MTHFRDGKLDRFQINLDTAAAAAADGMDMSGPLDMQNIAVWLFTEHGARKVAPPS